MARLATAKHKSQVARPALKMQYAALPYRDEGELQVLLVTSRETHRWIVPKGWPMASRHPWETAAREALEEAGVEGAVAHTPAGTYVYDKRMAGGIVVPCAVEVFPLKVVRQRKHWREREQRDARWFTIPEAIANVQEQGLKIILRQFGASYKA